MKLLLRKRNDLFSRLICWATEEEFSHCGVEIDGLVYESTFLGGCAVSVVTDFKHGATDYFELELGLHTQAQLNRAYDKLGSTYDWPNIIFLAFIMVLRRVGIKFDYNRLVVNPRLFICSEYSNYVIFGDKQVITPGNLLNKCIGA